MIQLLRWLFVGVCLIALMSQASADALPDAERAFDEGNFEKAAKLFKPLAAKGEATAQFKLGMLYYAGKGVHQDLKEAEKLFRLAAEQGHVSAQSNLATMYYSGVGVKQDFVLAHMWKDIAASRAEGEKQQRYRDQLAGLEKSMKPAQIAEAKKLAKKCVANKFKGCKRSR